jgi:hypothetical protein
MSPPRAGALSKLNAHTRITPRSRLGTIVANGIILITREDIVTGASPRTFEAVMSLQQRSKGSIRRDGPDASRARCAAVIAFSLSFCFSSVGRSGSKGIVTILLEMVPAITRFEAEPQPAARIRAMIGVLHQALSAGPCFENPTGGVIDSYQNSMQQAHLATSGEFADELLRGIKSGRMLPEEASRCLADMADVIDRALRATDGSTDEKGSSADRGELTALAQLARYHSQKILAAAGLALFDACGDESALRSAEAHAAAGLEVWRRLTRLTDAVHSPTGMFGPRDDDRWENDQAIVRRDISRLAEVQALFKRYGLFDLGLDFGPPLAPRVDGFQNESVERRFRLLDSQMVYSSQLGYGWLGAEGIRASEQILTPLAFQQERAREELLFPSAVLYGDFLRGSRKTTLLVNLEDGDYRITSVVANTPELASGNFQIRSVGTGKEKAAIGYRPGEYGDKYMDVLVTGGRLALDFVPEPGKDWLVSGLIFIRHVPHIGHVPVRSARAGTYTNITVSITAPDGMSSASLYETIPSRTAPATCELTRDGSQFSGRLEWKKEWEGKRISYHIEAVDGAGHVGRLPSQGEFIVNITKAGE